MPRRAALLILIFATACQASPEAPEEVAPSLPVDSPAVIEGRVAAADDVPIAYSVEGEGEVAVVLIHGWACDRSYWRAQIEPLIAGYKVVSVDLPGHGSSGLDREQWTLPAFGADVQAVVGDLGLEKVVLIGHSMGGPVALEAARRLGSVAVGVIAVDALHDVSVRPDPEQWLRLMESYETDFAGTCDQFVRSMFLETADPELIESTAHDMCDGPADVATALMAQFGDYDMAAALAEAATPVRAINSAVYPTNLEGNRTVAADFDVRVLEGVGHFPMLVTPEALNRHLLEVLAELTAS
ncbi:MAG: alpha/beta hydrolase [Acidobacteriota bacterium]